MVREIVKDPAVLTQVSLKATKSDASVVRDLMDTANAHVDRCVGLAAIQIGVPKRIIVAKIGDRFTAMMNPFILKVSRDIYETEEGCMSIDGVRKVKRHRAITVGFETISGKKTSATLMGFPAQIVQHEVDHCLGILI